MKLDITPKIFFMSGMLAFAIIGLCNLINFFIFYSANNFFSHIASLAGIVFNAVTVGFFGYLLKTQVSTLPENNSNVDLEEAIKEFK